MNCQLKTMHKMRAIRMIELKLDWILIVLRRWCSTDDTIKKR